MERAFSPFVLGGLEPGALPQAGMGTRRWRWRMGRSSFHEFTSNHLTIFPSGSDRLCPTPPGKLAGMKTHYAAEETMETLIATFGAGRLVRCGNGRFELRGGTHRDLVDAREWASLFMPEVTLHQWCPAKQHPPVVAQTELLQRAARLACPNSK